MTASEVMARVAARWPHTCDESIQRALLDRLDGLARAQIDGLPPAGTTEGDEPALAVPAPYDGVYEHYLTAMLAQMEGETGRYNNEMILFNTMWDECARAFRRAHLPEKEVQLHVPV